MGVLGARGKVGRVVCEAVAAADDLELVAELDVDDHLEELVGSGAQVLGPIIVGKGARIGANAVVTRDVPEGASMVGIPARPTLIDADTYKSFMPYGTPCSERFDPATQQLEILKCEVETLRGKLAKLIEERDATGDDTDRQSA